jgi:hypothetical protein
VPDADPKPQADKFRDLARELECDESEERFEEAVRRVATVKPQGDHTPEGEGSQPAPE